MGIKYVNGQPALNDVLGAIREHIAYSYEKPKLHHLYAMTRVIMHMDEADRFMALEYFEHALGKRGLAKPWVYFTKEVFKGRWMEEKNRYGRLMRTQDVGSNDTLLLKLRKKQNVFSSHSRNIKGTLTIHWLPWHGFTAVITANSTGGHEEPVPFLGMMFDATKLEEINRDMKGLLMSDLCWQISKMQAFLNDTKAGRVAAGKLSPKEPTAYEWASKLFTKTHVQFCKENGRKTIRYWSEFGQLLSNLKGMKAAIRYEHKRVQKRKRREAEENAAATRERANAWMQPHTVQSVPIQNCKCNVCEDVRLALGFPKSPRVSDEEKRKRAMRISKRRGRLREGLAPLVCRACGKIGALIPSVTNVKGALNLDAIEARRYACPWCGHDNRPEIFETMGIRQEAEPIDVPESLSSAAQDFISTFDFFAM